MSVRNFLNAGDYAIFMPVGIPLTIQYNSDGNIQKCIEGFVGISDSTDNIEYVSSKLYDLIVSYEVVPRCIPIKNGVTRVFGVLYTPLQWLYNIRGYLNGSQSSHFINDVLELFENDPSAFKFYASCLKSTGINLLGAYNQQNWLSIAKFNTIPGFIVPITLTDDHSLVDMLNRVKYPFNALNTMSVISYRGNDVKLNTIPLKQFEIESVDTYIDVSGEVKSSICLGDITLNVNYPDVVKFNLLPGKLVILNEYNNIVYSYYKPGDTQHTIPSKFQCPYCSKYYDVPKSGSMICPDDDCSSRLPQRICQFLNTLNLPMIYPIEDIQKRVKNHSILSLADIFLLDGYKDMKIDTTLKSLLRAVIPLENVHNNTLIHKFIDRCNNNVLTFEHYLTYPDKIQIDLELNDLGISDLVNWLKQPYNVSDITTLVSSDNICLNNNIKSFDGPNIFKDMRIYITGKFKHGSHSDISTILHSYGATVDDTLGQNDITEYSIVIVGDLNENTESYVVESAESNNISVYTESQFFNKFTIDDDLNNLV